MTCQCVFVNNRYGIKSWLMLVLRTVNELLCRILIKVTQPKTNDQSKHFFDLPVCGTEQSKCLIDRRRTPYSHE